MNKDEAIKEIQNASDEECRFGDIEHHYEDVMKRIEAFDMAVEALRAQNEEKEATWMIEPNETGFYKCSACGFGALVSFPHCPGCGKRMKKFWEE